MLASLGAGLLTWPLALVAGLWLAWAWLGPEAGAAVLASLGAVLLTWPWALVVGPLGQALVLGPADGAAPTGTGGGPGIWLSVGWISNRFSWQVCPWGPFRVVAGAWALAEGPSPVVVETLCIGVGEFGLGLVPLVVE